MRKEGADIGARRLEDGKGNGRKNDSSSKGSMKDGAARAVLREAWLRGHRCVELQQDGKRTIFVCTRCGTRCYSDSALVDHLQGNLHARVTALISPPSQTLNRSEERFVLRRVPQEQEGDAGLGHVVEPSASEATALVQNGISSQDAQFDGSGSADSPKAPLRWIGTGELLFSARGAGSVPLVEATWFRWKGKGSYISEAASRSTQSGELSCAVVVFPYSDNIGRGGNWKPWFGKKVSVGSEDVLLRGLPNSDAIIPLKKLGSTAVSLSDANPDSAREGPFIVGQDLPKEQQPPVGKEVQGKVIRRGWKRRHSKVLERICFICHQKMTANKDVAALLNMQTRQMVCGSRNKRGPDRSRKIVKSKRATLERTLKRSSAYEDGSSALEGHVFCPECQGTGLKVRGSQLERPRYRLAQVFDWILELVQARKAWSEGSSRNETSQCGLLFRDDLKGGIHMQGLIHCFSNCPELLAGNGFGEEFDWRNS